MALTRRRPGFRVFRVDAYGAPAYPELVLCTTRSELKRDPRLARSVVEALVRGYESPPLGRKSRPAISSASFQASTRS